MVANATVALTTLVTTLVAVNTTISEHGAKHPACSVESKNISYVIGGVFKEESHFLFSFICFLSNFGLGAVAAIIAKTVCAPIERVKLLLQLQDANDQFAKMGQKKYSGIFNAFARCIKEQGILSLWRGNGANILRYFPQTAFDMAFKEHLKHFFKWIFGHETFAQNWAAKSFAGGSAAGLSLFIVFPLDFVRTTMAADIGADGDRKYDGIWDCLKKVFQADGILGLYNGFGISIVGIIVYKGLKYGMFDAFKDQVYCVSDNVTVNFIMMFFYGWAIAATCATIAYPIDTVRRRMMLQSNTLEPKYSGVCNCFKKMYAEEGIRGFYNGAFSNIIHAFGTAVMMTVYDVGREKLIPQC